MAVDSGQALGIEAELGGVIRLQRHTDSMTVAMPAAHVGRTGQPLRGRQAGRHDD
jgi:hypothetical protein